MKPPRTARRSFEWSLTLVLACGVSNCAVQPSLPSRPSGYEMPSQAEMEEQFNRQRGRTQRAQPATSSDGIELVIPKGHSGGLTAVALSPDGRFIASLSADDTAKLWDIASGREMRSFTGFEYLMAGGHARFTPDSKRLIVADMSDARIYEVESGRELYRQGSLTRMAPLIGSDGRQAVTTDAKVNDGTPILVDAASRKTVWALPKQGTQQPFAWSADGRVLITLRLPQPDAQRFMKGDMTGITDGELLIWDVPARKLSGRLPIKTDSVQTKVLSRDGGLLALERTDRTITVIELQSRKELVVLNRDKVAAQSGTYSLAFSQDGRLLAWGASDGTARVWEIPSGRVTAELQASTVNFSADGATLVLGGGRGGAPWLRELASGKETRLAGASSGVGDITVLARGERALAGMQDGTAKLWDLTSGEVVRTFNCLRAPMVSSVAVSADERLAALGCMDGSAVLWDLASGRQVRDVPAPRKPGQKWQYFQTYVRFAPDGKSLVVAAADEVALWDLATGEELRRFAVPAGAANNPLTALQPYTTAQMDPNAAQMMTEGMTHIRALALHPGGKLVAVSNATGVTLWDLGSGQLVSAVGARKDRGGGMAAIAEAMRKAQAAQSSGR